VQKPELSASPSQRSVADACCLWRATVRADPRLAGDQSRAVAGGTSDGVIAQQANYQKSGFRLAYRNIRFRGLAQSAERHRSIVPAKAVGFDAIRKYDRKIFPAERDEFLRAWLSQQDAGAFAATGSEGVTGYAVIRRCREG
jgi:Acetyltransferase (GNAT) domain